jgi:hypothetical protein
MEKIQPKKGKKSNPKKLKYKKFFWLPELPKEQNNSIFRA